MSKKDMFLALSGSRQGAIQGESSANGHNQEIEINSWSWGMSQDVNLVAHGQSKASSRAIQVTKDVDRSSTAIMSALKSAEVLSEVVLVCRDSGGERPIDYLKIRLRSARICDYEISGAGSESNARQVQETFSLAFKDIEVTYTPKSGPNTKNGACTFVDSYE
ncbi:MAG: type VI secretion system tube protein Hcp [Limnobacter sp.]|nr:type VI secretion system tube protein Hcp [Limnobacter sp.]